MPIEGQAVSPDERLDTLVVQLEVLEEIVKSLGKVIVTEFSIPAPGADGFAQKVPESATFAVWLLSLTYAFENTEAKLEQATKRQIKTVK